MVLNICDHIGVRVSVDLSIVVTWMIVAFAVTGRAWAYKNFEIGGLFVHLALSYFRKTFRMWPYYSTYRSLCL